MTVTLLVIIAFPAILTLGFGLALVGSAVVFRGSFGSQIGRSGYLVYAIMIGLLALFVTRRGEEIAADSNWFQAPFSWPAPGVALAVVAAAGIGVGLFLVELYLSVLVRRAAKSVKVLQHPLVEGASAGMAGLRSSFIRFMTRAILIAGAEELLWRGYLIQGSNVAWGWHAGLALLVSSVSFGLNHYYFGARNVALKSLDGAVWGLLFLASGSIWLPFVSHCSFNVCAWRRLTRQR